MASPLSALAEICQELQVQILCQLPLRALVAVSGTCRSLRAAAAAVLRPDQQWLARAHRYPAHHPLLQAPCARDWLGQPRRLYDAFSDAFSSGSVEEVEIGEEPGQTSVSPAPLCPSLVQGLCMLRTRAAHRPGAD